MTALPIDIENYIARHYAGEMRETVRTFVANAVIEDGTLAVPRLRRCVLVGSGESLEKLQYLINLLRVDWRDVIMAGEYHLRNGKLTRLYNFAEPIPEDV